MKKVKVLCLVLALIMIVGAFAACGAKEDPADAPATDGGSESQEPAEGDDAQEPAATNYKIGVQVGTLEQTYYQMCVAGIEGGVKEGDEVVTYSCEWDQETQLDQVNDMITKEFDAIIMAPMDSEGCIPSQKAISEAGIALVLFDLPPAEGAMDYVDASCLISDYDIGYNGGKSMAEGLNEKFGAYEGHVLTYCYDAIVAGENRLKGFLDAIGEYEGIEHVYNACEEWDSETAMGVVANYILAHPEINGFWTWNDTATLGGLQAIKEAGREDEFVITTNDATKAICDEITAGNIYAGLELDPVGLGTITIETVYKVLAGEEVEETYYNEITPIYADNLEDAVSASFQAN